MSRTVLSVALFCLTVAICFAAWRSNNPDPANASPSTTAATGPWSGANQNYQPPVIEQKIIGAVPAGASTSTTLPTQAILTAETPQYATSSLGTNSQANPYVVREPERIVVERRVVCRPVYQRVCSRNRLHLGRTLYESAHFVLNLPNRIWGP